MTLYWIVTPQSDVITKVSSICYASFIWFYEFGFLNPFCISLQRMENRRLSLCALVTVVPIWEWIPFVTASLDSLKKGAHSSYRAIRPWLVLSWAFIWKVPRATASLSAKLSSILIRYELMLRYIFKHSPNLWSINLCPFFGRQQINDLFDLQISGFTYWKVSTVSWPRAGK